MKITRSELLALRVIKEAGDVRPEQFARAMWPDSPSWRSHSRVSGGRGVVTGAGIRLRAGSYLRRLERKGLLCLRWKTYNTYTLTSRGREILERLG